MELEILTRPGPELGGDLEALAALRIEVFREWPYLYQGSIDYEREYLSTYLGDPASRVVTVRAGGELVGMSTCLPLADEIDEFREPVAAAGWPVERMFYFGESVLLPGHRGQGIGRRFMAERLAAARAHGGMEACCFCAVIREPEDERRPEGYRPLDGFWRKVGFEPQAGVEAELEWQEAGRGEVRHRLGFWMRRL